jgi:hypothetical protein
MTKTCSKTVITVDVMADNYCAALQYDDESFEQSTNSLIPTAVSKILL